MDWKKLLGSIPASVDEALRLHNAYLVAENRMLRQQISGRVHLADSDRIALAELGQRLGKKAPAQAFTVQEPSYWDSPARQPNGHAAQQWRRGALPIANAWAARYHTSP